LSVSDILLQGCPPVIVEGPSDQYYLNSIKQYLIRTGKLAPMLELVFMPSGGCTSKAVKAIAGLVSGKSGELPYIIFDSDKTANSAKQQLLAEMYNGADTKIVSMADIIGFDNSEVEDLIPISLMQRPIDRLFHDIEDEEFHDVYNNSSPIIPQIESFAQKHTIVLEKGWKVQVAKSVKQQLQNLNTPAINTDVVAKWETLFGKLTLEKEQL
jgi:hypothetical protein